MQKNIELLLAALASKKYKIREVEVESLKS
jgi:hypothetical protein